VDSGSGQGGLVLHLGVHHGGLLSESISSLVPRRRLAARGEPGEVCGPVVQTAGSSWSGCSMMGSREGLGMMSWAKGCRMSSESASGIMRANGESIALHE